MVITEDSDSSNLSSNLGGTYIFNGAASSNFVQFDAYIHTGGTFFCQYTGAFFLLVWAWVSPMVSLDIMSHLACYVRVVVV